jgi:type IV pilus assembly protein PilC
MRRQRKARQQFWSATIYPAIVLILALFVTVYLVVYLIPRLQLYLQSLGRELPVMTQQLIDGTTWLRTHLVTLAGCGVAAIALGAFAFGSERGRLWFDRLVLRLPVLGSLIRNAESAACARGLYIMLESGLTLTECMATVQSLLSNSHLSRLVGSARDQIMRGASLAEAIGVRGGFTPMFNQMVAVGQQSGEMARVMREAAEFHDDQFQSAVQRLQAIATPAITLLVGGVVGYIYIAFFLALFSAGT